MNDTQKILRNWKVLWTTITIILSISVFLLSIRYNEIIFREVGLSYIKFAITQNHIGNFDSLIIKIDNIHGLLNLVAGLFTMLLINLLQIPIWIWRNKLVK